MSKWFVKAVYGNNTITLSAWLWFVYTMGIKTKMQFILQTKIYHANTDNAYQWRDVFYINCRETTAEY